jgi:phosphatidylserine/phosphatidylglycerophosphate/cardiolipin synthase-like enzyme
MHGDRLHAVRDGWPGQLVPTIRAVDVGMARTIPALRGRSEIREVETLNLAAIAHARKAIYVENQYLASRVLADALAARLREADGPEIVIVMPRSSESRLEQQSMDTARHRLLRRLWSADEHQRLAVYWPVTEGGGSIYVHAKVLVIDDCLVRIGSSNLNNRSMGFDSECELAVEAVSGSPDRERTGRMITSIRNRLLSEHLDVTVDDFEAAMHRCGTLLTAVGTCRKRKDVAAVRRSHGRGRGRLAGRERLDGSRPRSSLSDPGRTAMARGVHRMTSLRAG